MFATKPRRFTFALLVYIVLVFTLTTTSNAKAYASLSVNRRDHGPLKRLIKKRSPFPQLAVIGAAAAPPLQSATQTSAPVHTSQTSLPADSTQLTSTSTSTSSSDSSVASSGSESSTSTSTSSVSSASSTTSASTSSTKSTASPTSGFLDVTAEPGAASDTGRATVTRTSEAAASSTSSAQSSSGVTKTTSTTVTALIVIAASVGGVAILWTIFRKWKLGRSTKFDTRLQPIDWQPTNPEDGIVPEHRRANSDTSSFHSGADHAATSDLNHGNSDSGHGAAALAPFPDHDFTAGPSHLAPVGGYADLSRGPSPQPQMQEALVRGPSLTRPNYDLGVPLHHQTGYGVQDTQAYNGRAMRY